MTTPTHSSGPDLRHIVARGVRELSEVSGLPVSFGGQVAGDSRTFVISELHGTRTQSLRQLQVRRGLGLGGKALQLTRPAMVQDYVNARGITHRYDQAVTPERLQAVLAVPIQVKGAARAVVYVASREDLELGDRLLDKVSPVLRKLERDLAIEEEVHRRVAVLAENTTAPARPLTTAEAVDGAELHAELTKLADSVGDDQIRTRLRNLCDRVAGLSIVDSEQSNTLEIKLSKREREVLSFVSIGCSNLDIANRLGLLPNTVKAYVKTAIRKLGATNRFQAAHRARLAGLITPPAE